MDYINQLPTEAVFTVLALLCLCIGSFLNVVIHRMPLILKQSWTQECHEFLNLELPGEQSKISLCSPSSHCIKCQYKLRWYDNIPIISYILLRGKCRNCKSDYSPRYFQVEVLTLALSLGALLHFPEISGKTFLALIFTWLLISIAFIDIENMIIPDSLNYSLLWLGLICNQHAYFTSLSSAVWGSIAGYLSLWSTYHIFKFLTKKEGMGFGDFKLFAAAGAWLGYEMLPLIILVASALGSIVGLFSIMLKLSKKESPMPFGPYLCIGTWLAMFWGQDIYSYYLSFFIGA